MSFLSHHIATQTGTKDPVTGQPPHDMTLKGDTGMRQTKGPDGSLSHFSIHEELPAAVPADDLQTVFEEADNAPKPAEAQPFDTASADPRTNEGEPTA